MVIIKVDIIGGSIGGLSTAITLRELDQSIKVVVHEKHKKIGYNHEGRRCGEAYSIENEWKKWKPEGKSVFNNILKGKVILGNHKKVFLREPGTAFILNRQEFICQLERKAKNLGAKIQTDDKVKSVFDLDGEFIIDASGCPSFIKREIGYDKGVKGVIFQQTIEDSNYFIPDTIKIIFTGLGGYYWIFPRNPEKKEINLGVGFSGDFGYNLKQLLEKFKEENNIQGKVNYVLGGLIPIGLQPPFKYKNILFVGDAGVGTFPFSGQGIYRALISGDIAGRCIVNNRVNKYPHMINKAFIKWDVIGKMFRGFNYAFGVINPNLVISSYRYLTDFARVIHL